MKNSSVGRGVGAVIMGTGALLAIAAVVLYQIKAVRRLE